MPATDRLRRPVLALLALLLSGASPALFAVPEIQHWRTGNGAAVYFVAAPQLPMVDIRVVFAAGASRDGDRPGIGALTNALLAEGAGGMDADTIARRFDEVGAHFSNDSIRDMSIVGLRSLTAPERLEPAVETFAAVIGEPEFPTEALERERSRMLVALQRERQSPGTVARKRFYAELYGEHPYSIPVLGTEESLQALDREAVAAHYRAHYVGRNAVVAIVGDLDRAAAEGLAERVTAGLEPGEAPAALPEPQPAASDRIHIAHPSTQTHILMGQLGVARGDEQWFSLYVGNHILGGNGLVSRISQEVREKRGLAYSASSHFSPMEERGPFILGLQTANDNRGPALEVLRDTLVRFVEEGPDADEVEAAKKNITGGFPLDIDSNAEIVGYLSMIGFYDLPLDYLDRFTDRVEAVTAESIRRAFAERIDPERLLVVTVGRGDG